MAATKPQDPCRACSSEVDHCHGTVVIHADGSVDCTEVRCVDVSETRHSYVLACSIALRECGCREGDVGLH